MEIQILYYYFYSIKPISWAFVLIICNNRLDCLFMLLEEEEKNTSHKNII